LKTPAAILLLISLAYQCLGSLGVFVWFEANQEYIAANWCINRNRPMLHCNGQCILAQKLRKLDDRKNGESNQGTTGVTKLEIPAFIPQHRLGAPSISQENGTQPFSGYLMYYLFFFSADIFRPPIA